MKVASLIALPVLVSGAAVPLQPRAAGNGTGVLAGLTDGLTFDSIPKPLRGAAGDLLKSNLPGFVQWGASNVAWLMRWANHPVAEFNIPPVLNKKAQKKILRYGPFSIKGTNETSPDDWHPFWQMDKGSSWFLRTLHGFPNNSIILSAKPSFSYKDGSKADFGTGIYAHHVLVADLSKRTAPFALCPKMHNEDNFDDWMAGYAMDAVGAGLIQVGNDAIGAANIYEPENGSVKSGFKTGLGDMFGFQGELVNYKPQAQNIYIDMEIEYLPQLDEEYIDASTIVLSAMGCKDPDYSAPTGKNISQHLSEPFDITQKGYILNARGHLHDGGTSIDLILNGKNVCSSKPTYGRTADADPKDPETIVDMSWCQGPIAIKPGDVLNVETNYDIGLHPLRQSSGGHDDMAGMHMKRDGDHGGMSGASEMGIMTTNFAWLDKPDEDTQSNPAGRAQSGLLGWVSSWFGGDKKPAATAPAAAATTTATVAIPAALAAPAAPAADAAPAAPAPAPAPAAPAAPAPAPPAEAAPAPAAPAAPAADPMAGMDMSGGDGHSHSH